MRAVEQLQGAPVPASALERLVLPSRVAGYAPPMLDELTASGEVVWAGAGALPGKDGWIALHPADAAPLLLPPPHPLELTPVHRAVLDALSGGYGLFFRQIAEQVRAAGHEVADAALAEAVWDLAWSGRLTNDTLGPLRALLGSGRTAGATAHRARRTAPRGRWAGSTARPAVSRGGPPTVAGRWSLLPDREADPTLRAHALARTLLDRHGVVTRGAVAAEGVEGGFAAAYRVLSAFEESGQARRGYVVEGLGAAQFAMDGAVDRLRAISTAAERGAVGAGPGAGTGPQALVLAATDPANAFGAALPWPDAPPAAETGGAGHKPGRKAGALVTLVNGRLTLYLERGGRTLLAWPADDAPAEGARPDAALRAAAEALARAARDGALGTLTVERVNGAPVLTDPFWSGLLEAAGFHATPRGLRLRP